jgi:phosphoribosylformylglycinamidine synthase
VDDIAAVCDPSGRVFGLMPHPEAYVHYTQHPRWTRESLPEEGMGVQIFRNAVAYARMHLV